MKKLLLPLLVLLVLPTIVSAVVVSNPHNYTMISDGTYTETAGVSFVPHIDLSIASIERVPGVTADSFWILDGANNTITGGNFTSDIYTFTEGEFNFSANTWYAVMMGVKVGASAYNGPYTAYRNTGVTHPVQAQLINYTVGLATWTGNGSTPGALTTQILNVQNISFYFGAITTTLSTPVDNSLIVTNRFNSSVISSQTLANASLYVWNTNGTEFAFNTTTISGLTNSTELSVANLYPETYYWNYRWCDTDNTCAYAPANYTFTYGYINNSITYNATTVETAQETFEMNLSLGDGLTLSSAILNYDGTNYTGTVTASGNESIISRTLDIPLISSDNQNVTYYWNLHLTQNASTYVVQTSNETQEIRPLNFSLVSTAGVTLPFINYTFTNETVAEESVTALISTYTVTYWSGSGVINKSYSYSNPGENRSYAFGVNQPERAISMTYSITYDNSESESRTYTEVSSIDLTNSSTSKELFLLPTSDGVFVTFQVINSAEQTIEGVEVTITRSGATIFNGLTDVAGLVNVFLNPSTSYSYTFEKSGYTTVTTSFAPSQTSYTINLGGASATVPDDYSRGITYTTGPKDVYLFNQTTYTFNLSLSSSFWELDTYGFTLRNSTSVLGTATGIDGAGGLVSLAASTTSSQRIFMDVFWEVNNTYNNVTREWFVISEGDTDFSISKLVSDFTSYVNVGFFGLTNFGLNILIFLIMFVSVGVLSFKYGLTSPITLAGVGVGIIALFDVGFNLIPSVGGVDHAPTIIAFVFLIATVVFRGGER